MIRCFFSTCLQVVFCEMMKTSQRWDVFRFSSSGNVGKENEDTEKLCERGCCFKWLELIVRFNRKCDICFRDSWEFFCLESLVINCWTLSGRSFFYKLRPLNVYKLKLLYSVFFGTMHSEYWLSILFFILFFPPLFNYFDKAIEILHIYLLNRC